MGCGPRVFTPGRLPCRRHLRINSPPFYVVVRPKVSPQFRHSTLARPPGSPSWRPRHHALPLKSRRDRKRGLGRMDDRSSLDPLYRQSSLDSELLPLSRDDLFVPGCPTQRDRLLTNELTGEIKLGGNCQKPSCPWCGPVAAHRRAEAMARSHPEFLMTITQAPREGWDRIRRGINKLLDRLRARHPNAEVVYVVENDPNGDDAPHIHGLVHSAPTLTGATLSEVAALTGFGPEVNLQRLPDFRRGTKAFESAASMCSRYMLKGVVYEKVGTPQAAEGLRLHLEANGGRLEHHTRGFYRGPDGEPVSVRDAVSNTRPPDRGWTVVPNRESVVIP